MEVDRDRHPFSRHRLRSCGFCDGRGTRALASFSMGSARQAILGGAVADLGSGSPSHPAYDAARIVSRHRATTRLADAVALGRPHLRTSHRCLGHCLDWFPLVRAGLPVADYAQSAAALVLPPVAAADLVPAGCRLGPGLI